MTPQQRLALLGAITLIRLQRDKIDALEEGAAQLLEDFGAKVPDPRNAYDTVLSAVQDWCIDDRYDAEGIVDKIVEALEFEEVKNA
jgi:hypothetical protein